MVKIEFDKHVFDVPNSWADVALGHYEKWYMLKPENRLEYVQYVADIAQINAQELLDFPSEVFEAIATATRFAFETELEPKGFMTIGDEKYFMPTSDKLTLGEWIDVDTLLNSKDEPHRLSQLLAILCRPAGERYDVELSAQRQEMFQQLSCDRALPLLSFFLHRGKKLQEILNRCSMVAARADQYLKATKTLVANGDGTKRLPIWQRIRYRFLMKSLEKQLSKFSDLCSIE